MTPKFELGRDFCTMDTPSFIILYLQTNGRRCKHPTLFATPRWVKTAVLQHRVRPVVQRHCDTHRGYKNNKNLFLYIMDSTHIIHDPWGDEIIFSVSYGDSTTELTCCCKKGFIRL